MRRTTIISKVTS